MQAATVLRVKTSRKGRTGVRFYAHLPRWRLDPRSWSLAVIVTEGAALVANIDPIATGRRSSPWTPVITI